MLCFLLLFAMGTQAFGEAVLTPNQITGVIEFTNKNPEILDLLSPSGGDQGFTRGHVWADSIGVSPTLNHYTFPSPHSPTSIPYELVVESSEAGIPYRVRVYAWLGSGVEQYYFASQNSAPVFPEPAADVRLDFKECAGMLHIKFVNADGTPCPVDGNERIGAWRQRSPGSSIYDIQTWDYTSNGSDHEYLAVRGDGSLYRVDVRFKSELVQKFVTVGCDEIVEVIVKVPPPAVLGEIAGIVDMEGEDEHRIRHLTRMSALNGPLGCYLWQAVLESPSQGLFRLPNLVPSDAQSPPRPYLVRGEMAFRTGYRYEYFRTPWLYGPYYNSGVYVEAGKTTDLGETFVMNPGYVVGQILLAGPPSDDGGSVLEDIYRDAQQDYDRNGLPDELGLPSSHVVAFGTNRIANGATMCTFGGEARVGFTGSFNPATDSFEGDYEMVVGGLLRERSIWRPDTLTLKFIDRKTPDQPGTYQYSWLRIKNQNVGDREIVPMDTIEIDHSYCMSQVNVAYKSLSGTFYNPKVRAYGDFSGEDFQGNPANYTASLAYANGTPMSLSSASSRGLVTMTLPSGSYTFTPTVMAVNPSGGISNTELPPVTVDVGCRQVINLTTDLQISLNDLPEETTEQAMVVSGSVNSNGTPVDIYYSQNMGSESAVCMDCGEDPNFSFEVMLEAGENEITVSATDGLGNEASVTALTDYIPPPVSNPPVISGCDDITVEVDPEETGAVVMFDITATEGCEGSPEVTCEPSSGSFFLIGETTVTCTALDTCGDEDECSFTVTVVEREVETPCDDDTAPPEVTSSIETTVLWPPNHNLVDVGLEISAVDSCDGDASDPEDSSLSLITEIWSDEAEISKRGRGSGRHAPDAKYLDSQLRLRSERSGGEDGRVYLIITKATDTSGNTGFACSTVVVPHDQSEESLDAVNAQAFAAESFCNENGGRPPAGFTQHGLSKEIGPKQ
jgi:hypothetical protein